MSFLDPENPRRARILITAGLAVFGGLLVATVLARRRGVDLATLPKAKALAPVPPKIAPRPAGVKEGEMKEFPTPRTPEEAVGQAMDMTQARLSLARLKMAVVSGDPVSTRAVQKSLGAYPRFVIEALTSELGSEEIPGIRQALIDSVKEKR